MKKSRNLQIITAIACIVFLITLPVKVRGQDETFKLIDDPDWLIAEINNSTKNIKTIRSGFEQIKRLEFLEEEIRSSGIFYFKGDDLLRWEYTDPYSYIIVFRDDKILINDNTHIRSFEIGGNRMFQEISGIMLGMVSGTILENDAFKAEYYENDTNYLLKLFPSAPGISEFLDEIHLFLDKQDHTVDRVIMKEKSGDFTKINFNNKVLNENIQDQIFTVN